MPSEFEDEDSSRSPRRSKETNSNNSSLDDSTASSASQNVSIIGKVKSHVSSIIPSKISKWFSPSTSTNNKNTSGTSTSGHSRDTINGCIVNMETGGSRRRRRIELDYDDDDEDADDVGNAAVDEEEAELADNIAEHDLDGDELTRGEYNVKMLRSRHMRRVEEDDNDGEVDADDFVDEDDEDDDDEMETDTNTNTLATLNKRSATLNTVQRSNKNTNSSNLNVLVTRQPPSKRIRLSTTDISLRDSPLLPQRRPLVASTPSTTGATTSSASSARNYNNRLTHLNPYGNQTKREPACNFSVTAEPALATSGDLPATSLETSVGNISIVRRSLNIPTLDRHTNLPNLRRQSLLTTRIGAGNSGLHSSATLSRPSTTIHEPIDERGEVLTDYSNGPAELNIDNNNINNDNLSTGENRESVLLNGRSRCISGEVIGLDTASEASNDEGRNSNIVDDETLMALGHNNNKNDKDDASRSRTSSFGNSIHFFAHLQGRKSLFGNGQQSQLMQHQQPHQSGGSSISCAFNNSTLSLTSLNRRQFNASIYGSTSALSDSRLLNIFSPFYKGRTTYGGASAYHKYNTTLGASGGVCAAPGVGAGFSRIAPTVIRPTSSLSTLSSSSNSATLGGVGGAVGAVQSDKKLTNVAVENNDCSSTSDTAQRILELLKDFTTPLIDAKKVASNLKEHQQLAMKRLKESDLETNRMTRSQNKPYMRPLPQPPRLHNGVGIGNSPMPSTRELHVPKMAQLLQMRRVQGTTELVRGIMTEKSDQQSQSKPFTFAKNLAHHGGGDGIGISSKPISGIVSSRKPLGDQPLGTKHTSKMRTRMTTLARTTGFKDASRDLEVMPEVNLPNILFPAMQSVPKFDMELAKPNVPYGAKHTTSASTSATATASTKVFTSTSTSVALMSTAVTAPIKNFAFNPVATTSVSTSTKSASISNSAFSFATPINLTMEGTKHLANFDQSYKFSQPMYLGDRYSSTQNSSDTNSSSTGTNSSNSGISNNSKSAASFNKEIAGFGPEFRKSSDEWDCDICLVRNKSDVNKCISCESPRAGTTATKAPTNVPLGTLVPVANSWSSTSFGDKFKKSSSEWECNECMIRNKEEASKCVACETPRKCASATSTTATLPSSTAFISNTTPNVPNLFGNAFKPKADTWECDTCLVVNKMADVVCIACQTKKPGSMGVSSTQTTTSAPIFQFGFAATPSSTSLSSTSSKAVQSDRAFQSLAAAQKTDKWSCSACFAQNEVTRNKCVCCEEAKPGSLAISSNSSGNEPKFAFGQSATSKFKFGFAKDQTDAVPAVETAAAAPATTAVTTGFTFANILLINTSSTTSGAGIAVGANSQTGFTFGSGAIKTDTQTTTEEKSAKTVTFNLPAVKSNPSATTATSDNKIVAGGFSFGTGSASGSGPTLASNIKPTKTATFAETGVTAGAETIATTKATTMTSEFPAVGTTTATPTAPAETTANANFSFGAKTIETNLAPAAAAAASATATDTKTTAKFNFGLVSGPTFAPKNVAASPAAAVSTAAKLATPNATFTFGTFGAGSSVTAAATTTPAAATIATTSAGTTTNLFGGFGTKIASNTASTSTTATASITSGPTLTSSSIFGQHAATSVPSPTATAASNNFIFGQSQNAAAPSATLPTTTTTSALLFGNSSSSTTVSAPSASSGPTVLKTPTNNSFVFGSAGATAHATLDKSKLPATSTSSNTFSGFPSTLSPFGQVAAPTTAAAAGAPVGAATTTTATATANNTGSVFGSFGVGSTFGNSNTSSIFGAAAAASAVSSSTGNSDATPVFGSATFGGPAATPAAATPAAANAAAAPSSSIFGSGTATPSGSTFGTFGNAASATPSGPITGAVGSTTFGGFSGAATAAAGTTAIVPKFSGFGANTTTPANKPAFNFSNATAMQNTTSNAASIFSFGSATAPTTGTMPAAGAGIGGAKPAFNFTATNPSTNFNFTGSALTNAVGGASAANATTADATTSSSSPFQFNAATAAPANIFAINPSSVSAQNAQQARRKIRAPIRRLTPR